MVIVNTFTIESPIQPAAEDRFYDFLFNISGVFYNTDASLISAPQRLFQMGIEAAKQRKYYRRQEKKRKDLYHHNGKKDNNFKRNANSKPKPQPDRTEH